VSRAESSTLRTKRLVVVWFWSKSVLSTLKKKYYENLPHAHKHRPEHTSANLLGDIVYFELSRTIVVGSIRAPRMRHATKIGITLSLVFMETQ
jgi:hypothetical protein